MRRGSLKGVVLLRWVFLLASFLASNIILDMPDSLESSAVILKSPRFSARSKHRCVEFPR